MDNRTRDEKQYSKMTQTPVSKLIIKLALPTTISMLVTAVYNLGDTFFVSKINTSASAAVGIVFSLMTIIQAVGFTLGMGAGSLLARKLGMKDKKAANKYAATSFYTSIVLGLVIFIFGKLFTKQLMSLLGATDTIMQYAIDYAGYILYAAPFMCASFVMNNILRSEGKASLAMAGLCTGGILNLILDPIFIFNMSMGTAGAALATLISQCISFAILLSMFIFRRSNISLSPKNISFRPKTYFQIVSTGFPSLCRQGFASVATVMLNRAAKPYGDPAIAAISIVAKIFMLILNVCLGIGQGFMPVVGYNYGAKKYQRVRKAFNFTAISSTIIMTSLGLVSFIIAPTIIKWFRADDTDVISIGTAMLRAQCFAMPFIPTVVCTNTMLQSLGKSIRSTILSCCRQGIFFIPLILILPKFLGIRGIEYTQPIADVLSFIVGIPLAITFFKGMRKEEQPLNTQKHS